MGVPDISTGTGPGESSQEAPAERQPVSVAIVEQRKPRGAGVLGSVQSMAVTIVIVVFMITFIVQAFQIPSESMENTLLIGDYLLVDKVHHALGGIWKHLLPYREIRRGDIIVFRYPVHPAQHFVKRVIALPGDRVRIVNKRVVVNGVPVEEKYVIHRSRAQDSYRDDFPSTDFLTGNVEARWWLEMRHLVKGGELTVPADRYFVLGDNRDESLDSRYWGFVPRENVIGRPLLIYWSRRSAGRIGGTPESAGDKLSNIAYALTHLVEDTRWDRTFRVVR